jgi:hypothetical protein
LEQTFSQYVFKIWQISFQKTRTIKTYIYIPILVKFCNKKRAKMGLNMGGAGGLFCISFKNLFGQVVKIYPQFNVKFA